MKGSQNDETSDKNEVRIERDQKRKPNHQRRTIYYLLIKQGNSSEPPVLSWEKHARARDQVLVLAQISFSYHG
jgi:hypothetical protein